MKKPGLLKRIWWGIADYRPPEERESPKRDPVTVTVRDATVTHHLKRGVHLVEFRPGRACRGFQRDSVLTEHGDNFLQSVFTEWCKNGVRIVNRRTVRWEEFDYATVKVTEREVTIP